jgi:LPXTG-site transpeptidase (sortase) family protein
VATERWPGLTPGRLLSLRARTAGTIWTGRLSEALIALGAAILLFAAGQYAVGVNSQARAPKAEEFQRGLVADHRAAPREGDVLGRLQIPAIGLDLAVFEGVSAKVLRDGPGHVPGTEALAQRGGSYRNCVITAHRDRHFRRLGKLVKGDLIRVVSPGATREYRVVTSRVVEPSHREVLGSTLEETLTLLTCYPFSYVGPAPRRYIVVATPV